MSNEPLGIYEELRAKSRQFEHIKAQRKRMLQLATEAPAVQQVNPFRDRRLPKRHADGFYARYPDHKRRRKVHDVGELGVTIAQVIKAVCLETELAHEELLGPRRKRRLAWPRHIAMWAVDHYCPNYSLKEIAYVFQRDHTSVMHGIQKTGERLHRAHPWTRVTVANVHQRLAALVEEAAAS